MNPIPNPYKYGGYIPPHLFVGQQKLINDLNQIWSTASPPLVVIHGPSQTGKSSLMNYLRQQIKMAYLNLQSISPQETTHTADTLFEIIAEIYDCYETEPNEDEFDNSDPFTTTKNHLSKINPSPLILAIDEYVLFEERIKSGDLNPKLIPFLKEIQSTYPWLHLVFVGLRSLRELNPELWAPFLENVIEIPMPPIDPTAARQLITDPIKDSRIDYDEAAIAAIVEQAKGQAVVVQLICHRIITGKNRAIRAGLEPDLTISEALVLETIKQLQL